MGLLAALGGIAKTFFAKKAVQQIVVPAAVNALVGKANQKAANKAAIAAYNQNKKDAANKYVDMSTAARKAGFNPLTVLRATGGAGFGSYGAPILSKRAFGLEFAANTINGFAKTKANEPIDVYNEQIRKLELEQRRLDIKLAKQTLTGMTQNRASGMPKVQSNVMEGYSLGMKNEYLAKHGLDVTTNTGVTPTEIGVDSRGNTYRKPAGEDIDEQLLNSVYHGVQQLRYGVLDAWNWATKGQRPPDMPRPTLNPNVPIIGTFESNGKLVMGPNFRDRFGVGAPYYNY